MTDAVQSPMSTAGTGITLDEAIAIGKVAHEANKQHCENVGDYSQPHWKDAPMWQKNSAIAGVIKIATGEIGVPADSHRSWMEHKAAEGWKYGEKKDPEKKEHPCMVPFEELPASDRIKDSLFFATVTALLPFYRSTQ